MIKIQNLKRFEHWILALLNAAFSSPPLEDLTG
jgi:hypothetical protein